MRAPDQGAKAGTQFGQVDRLDHIVVGATVQAADAVTDRVPRGQHQHRRRNAGGANLGQHVQTVQYRQAQIEYGGGVDARSQLALGG